MSNNNNFFLNEELKNLIKQYIDLFGQAEDLLQNLSNILLEYFYNAIAYENAKEDIMKFITLHLPEESQKILEEAKILPMRNRTFEQKQIAQLSTNIKNRVKRIFVKLKKDLYGLPILEKLEETPSSMTISSVNQLTEAYEARISELVEMNQNLQEIIDGSVSNTTVNALNQHIVGSVENTIHEFDLLSLSSQDRTLSNPEVHIGSNGKYQIDRGNGLVNTRWTSNVQRTTPQDLYETHPSSVLAIIHLIENYKEKIVYDPCCGKNAITDVLFNNGFTKTIGTDLFTTNPGSNSIIYFL